MKTLLITTGMLLFAGCTGEVMDSGRGPAGLDEGPGEELPTEPPPPAPTDTSGGVEDTFHHPASIGGTAIDVREALERMEQEGPPGFAARVHSCRKVRYRTLGRMLQSRGVNLDADGETSAGRMWREGDQALGNANYAARIAETTELTVATSSRMFDIFVQAAPEIIAAMPTREECNRSGVPTTMFDGATGACNRDGISCLLGVQATASQVAVCNDVVSRATSVEAGQAIAVAALLASSNTCE